MGFPGNRFCDGNSHAGDLLGKGSEEAGLVRGRSWDLLQSQWKAQSILHGRLSWDNYSAFSRVGGNGSDWWLISHTDQSLYMGHPSLGCTLSSMAVYSHGSSERRLRAKNYRQEVQNKLLILYKRIRMVLSQCSPNYYVTLLLIFNVKRKTKSSNMF